MPSMYIPASSPASFFLSRLELRLRKPSLKLRQVAPDKTTSSRAKPERSAAAAADTAAGVPQVSRACRGKVNGDRVSWCIRDWAAVAAGKGTSTPASALCQALVELDKTLAMVESTSVKYSADDQFYSLVSLCDVVTRGILLCLEDTASAAGGRYSRSLETLRGLVVKAKQVAGRLGAKGRLGLRSRKKHLHVNLERDLEAVSDAVYRFAASHKPELATDEHHYERNRVAFLASRVPIPPRSPQIREWWVPRREAVQETCRRLGIYSAEGERAGVPAVVANGDSGGGGDATDKGRVEQPPPVVGLGGPTGCGKSTVAAMVVAHEDVRGYFHEGVVWLPVGGKGAKHRLPELMARLASLVHDTEMRRSFSGDSRIPIPPPPRKACIAITPDRLDSAAFIRAVLGLSPPSPRPTGGSRGEKLGVDGGGGGGGRGRRYLIIADDVCEPEVLQELMGLGACVLYTTTRSVEGMRLGDGDGDGNGADADLLQLDDLREEEAETVLRRACGMPHATLPQTAHEMIKAYGSVAMDINYFGRWDVVCGKADEKAWDMALSRVFVEAGDGGERWTRRRWHTAVLFAGLADLARLNDKAKDLYLYLAVLPRGLGLTPQDAAALLFDRQEDSAANAAELESTLELLVLLERCSVLALEEDGRYRVHDSHARFVRDRISCFPLSRMRALSRWRRHVSTAAALFAWPVEDLVDIWRNVAELTSPGEAVERPYDAVLAGMDHSDDGASKLPTVLERVARFHALAADLGEAYAKYTRLVELTESKLASITRTSNGGGGGGSSGGDKLLLADHLHSLGCISAELGKADQAEAAHARARSIREEELGAHHPEVGNSLQVLAACAAAAGKPEAEQRLLQQALSIWDKHRDRHLDREVDGREKGGGAASALIRGSSSSSSGALARGGHQHQHQLDLHAARALQSLGGYAIQQGRPAEAEGLLRRAVASWEAALGGDHPSTARALHSLGVCFYDVGKIGEAAELYRGALKIRQEKLGPRHPEVASTMHNLGVCEWKAGRVEEAQLLYRTTLAIRVEALGAEHLHVARTLHSLGGCARHAGRSGEATALYRKALEIREAGLGPDHPEVAATLHELGVTAFGSTQIVQAESYLRRALAIKDVWADGPSLDTAYTLHDLGGVLLASGGRTLEAEALFQRALEIREGLGASLDAARTLHCLGECASERSGVDGTGTGEQEEEGKEDGEGSGERSTPRSTLEEAEGFYRRALEIQEKELGLDHLYVAHTLFQLGRSLCSSAAAAAATAAAAAGANDTDTNTNTNTSTDSDTGRRKSEEAMTVLSRSLAVREKELGRNHEDVLLTLHQLGACASTAGRVEEAEGWYRRIVTAEELTLGADHPVVARTLHQLGACVLKVGKIDEGVGLLRRSLDIPEEPADGGGGGGGGAAVGGGEGRRGHHLDVALTLQQLAVCAADAGRVDEADALFRSVLEIEERKLGPSHPDVADTLSNLGECALKADRPEDATRFYQRAFKIEEENFGADQPVLGSTLHCLGLCAEQAGRTEEAEELFRRSLAIEEKQMGADHPHVAATLAGLGCTALASGRTEEAEGLLTRALSITYKAGRGAGGGDSTAVVAASTLHSLAECAHQTGRLEEAEGRLRRALAIEERAHPPDVVAATLTQLAGWAFDGARWEEAERAYKRALALEEETLGESRHDVVGALSLSRIGKCLSQQDKMEEAAEMHRRALEIVEETEGDRSLEVTTILLDIGLCALTLGRMEEAEVLYKRALAIESEHLGADHPDAQATARALELFAPSS